MDSEEYQATYPFPPSDYPPEQEEQPEPEPGPIEHGPVEPHRKRPLRFVKITKIKSLPGHPLQNSIKYPKMSKMSMIN